MNYIFSRRKSSHIRIMSMLAALIFAVTACICFLLMPVHVFADDKEYYIPSAEFDVRIDNNGTVEVTENWTVVFEEGTFTRFYKDIYKAVPAEEKFSLDSDSFRVTIDGQECNRVLSLHDREDYTFCVEDGSDAYTYSCFLKSKDIRRSYQISYKLRDTVKFVDNEYYLFTMRFIPASFSKKVDSVTVKITTPDGSVVEIRNGQYFRDVVSEGNSLTVRDRDWNGVFKVKVRIDRTTIAGAVPFSSADVSNAVDNDMDKPWVRTLKKFLKMGLGLIPAFIAIVLFLHATVFKAASKAVSYKKISKILDEDPYFYFKIIEKWKPFLNPVEFAFGCSASSNSKQVFYSILSSLFYKGVLQSDDGNIIKIMDDRDLLKQESEVIHFISLNGETSSGDLSMEKFRAAITTHSSLLPKFEKQLKKDIQRSVESKLPKEEQKKYKKDWKEFSTYAKYYFDNELKTDVMENSNWPYFMIFNDWLSPNPLSIYPAPWIEHFSVLLTDYHDSSTSAYNSYYGSKSGSGGSSCSSCSSCSGCGGGGAD